MSHPSLQKRRWWNFYGWWMILACGLLASMEYALESFSFGVFFTPLVTEFGWSRAVTSGVMSAVRVVEAVAAPLAGFLIDRVGPRRVILFGVVLMGGGYVALSLANGLVMVYLVYGFAVGVGIAAGFSIPAYTAVNNWFIRKRGLAVALVSATMALTGAAIIPSLGLAVSQFHWRTAALMVGVGVMVVGFPLAFAVRYRPESYGYLPDGEPLGEGRDGVNSASVGLGRQPLEVDFSVSQAMKTWALWLLCATYFLRTTASSAITVHQIPLLMDMGISAPEAAAALGLLAFLSLPGRVLFGWLGDRFDKRYLLIISFILQGIGLVILMNAISMLQVYFYLAVYGLGYGSAPLTISMTGEYYGRKSFASLRGFARFFRSLGGMVGPVLAGYTFDVTGSYRGALIVFVVFFALAVPIIYFARSPQPGVRRVASFEVG